MVEMNESGLTLRPTAAEVIVAQAPLVSKDNK